MNNRIVKIGMDVHSTNYNLCAVEPLLVGGVNVLMTAEVGPDYKNILTFIEKLKKRFGGNMIITCGYEAGCLGFTLYHQLKKAGIDCVVLAPSTMAAPKGKRIKTDNRDARMIAECLANASYSAVHIPTPEDEEVRDYIRMRDDQKDALKKTKQHINALVLRYGFKYTGNKWTAGHIKWLKDLKLSDLVRETLQEYLAEYDHLTGCIERYDARIEELAKRTEYHENVSKLCCLMGIQTNTALSLIVETGDFRRFRKGNIYGAYLGMIPGEHSSGNDINRLSITKAGNGHLRKLLIEAAQGICRGRIGHKSKALSARQSGNSAEVIAYADKANERMRRKYYRLIAHEKPRNVAVTAVARELACFVWGLMTDNIDLPKAS